MSLLSLVGARVLAAPLAVAMFATSSVALAARDANTLDFPPHPPITMSASDRANGWADLAFFGSMTGGLGLIMVGDLMALSAPVMVPVVAVGVTLIYAPVVIGMAAMFSKRVHARVMALLGDPSEEQQLQGGNVARTAPTKSAPTSLAPVPAPAAANVGFHH